MDTSSVLSYAPSILVICSSGLCTGLMRHYDEKIMDILGGLFFSQESQPNRIVMEPNPNVYDSDMTLA